MRSTSSVRRGGQQSSLQVVKVGSPFAGPVQPRCVPPRERVGSCAIVGVVTELYCHRRWLDMGATRPNRTLLAWPTLTFGTSSSKNPSTPLDRDDERRPHRHREEDRSGGPTGVRRGHVIAPRYGYPSVELRRNGVTTERWPSTAEAAAPGARVAWNSQQIDGADLSIRSHHARATSQRWPAGNPARGFPRPRPDRARQPRRGGSALDQLVLPWLRGRRRRGRAQHLRPRVPRPAGGGDPRRRARRHARDRGAQAAARRRRRLGGAAHDRPGRAAGADRRAQRRRRRLPRQTVRPRRVGGPARHRAAQHRAAPSQPPAGGRRPRGGRADPHGVQGPVCPWRSRRRSSRCCTTSCSRRARSSAGRTSSTICRVTCTSTRTSTSTRTCRICATRSMSTTTAA